MSSCRRVAGLSAALTAVAAGAAAGGKVPVPGGRGCYTVADRAACCSYVDGRADRHYGGQDCVPSRPGLSFDVGRHWVVCQPSCWAHGTCGDGGDQSDRVGSCSAQPGTVDQEGAKVPVGGRLRFYAVGSSNAAWQTWPDQLHATLRGMGYDVALPETAIPGETTQPSKAPVCADADAYSELHTPRVGMVGWSSWGFAYESKDDCDADGYREIAGYPVSCTNGWACNPAWTGSVPMVPVSALARGVRDADVVVLANWINDYKSWSSRGARKVCYNDSAVEAAGSVKITKTNLRRTIRAIHAENPDVVVLVLARYADTKQVIYVNERTLPSVIALNEAVKESLKGEPNTHFVDLEFPKGENMFQTLSKVHPNCRGDKVMASSLVEAMFRHKVLARGLALGDAGECLARADCDGLDLACCQRSALCYVAGGTCAAYGPGQQ